MRSAYKEWLFARAEREIDEHCVRIFSVPDEISVLFREALAEWGAARALERMREAITVFCRPVGTMSPPNSNERLPLCLFWRVSPKLEELRREARQGLFKVDKRTLRDEVQHVLSKSIGTPAWTIGGLVRYVTHVADTTVYTDIDFSPRSPAKISYENIVVAGTVDAKVGAVDHKVILNNASVFNLLGTAPTTWSFITNEDVPRVAETLSCLCSELIAAVPDMVKVAREKHSDRKF